MTPQSFVFQKDDFKWIHASTKDQLVKLLHQYPKAKIINGNTEVGIEVRFKNFRYPVYINTADVAELKYMKIHSDSVEWGAITTITTFQSQLKELIKSREVLVLMDRLTLSVKIETRSKRL